MKIAFVYNKTDRGMSGKHWTNNAYRFFITGLSEYPGLDYQIFEVNRDFDCRQFNGFDVVILYSLENLEPIALDELDAIKVVRAPDSHSITAEWIKIADDGGVKLVINHHTPEYFYRFAPKSVPYEQIVFGITKRLHTSPPFKGRGNKVLLTGAVHCGDFYDLRIKCGRLQGVEYVGKSLGFVGDKYPELLGQYKAGIAACTVTSVYKYFEIPACGCLNFMEVNEQNGCGNLGFVDMETAVFIDEENYKERIAEFTEKPQDSRWKTIAANGRRFVLKHYENEVQITKLLRAIEEVAA